MPKQDFTEYEKRLSIDHERQCRTTLIVQACHGGLQSRNAGRDQGLHRADAQSRRHQDQTRSAPSSEPSAYPATPAHSLPRCMAKRSV